VKTKDEVHGVFKRWITEIADLRLKYLLLAVMRDNGGGNESATMNCLKCRSATYKKRLWTTPHDKIYGTKRDISKIREAILDHSVAGHTCISTKT
jgi:hypothetical protein